MSSTGAMRLAWARPCQLSPGRTRSFGSAGARITIDARGDSVWDAVEAIMAAHSYTIRPADTGAYNCRLITGGSGYSLHAYGIAVDVNWQSNPYGRTLVTDMAAAMIADIEAIRPARLGYRHLPAVRWGGRYSGNKDAMHFEILVVPAALTQGVTYPSAPETGAPKKRARRGGDSPMEHVIYLYEEGGKDRYLEVWQNGTDVAAAQIGSKKAAHAKARVRVSAFGLTFGGRVPIVKIAATYVKNHVLPRVKDGALT